MVKKREQVSERLQPEPREGRKFKFKGIKGGKDERDYNMMRRQRKGWRGGGGRASCLLLRSRPMMMRRFDMVSVWNVPAESSQRSQTLIAPLSSPAKWKAWLSCIFSAHLLTPADELRLCR